MSILRNGHVAVLNLGVGGHNEIIHRLTVHTPGTPTLMCIVGHISVLQNEKYPLFADFWPENLPYFCQNAPFLGENTDFLKVSFST